MSIVFSFFTPRPRPSEDDLPPTPSRGGQLPFYPPPAGDRHPPTETVGISEIIIKLVIPAQAGIQNLLKILDSPVSSTGQAQSRASLVRNDKKENYDTVSLKRGTLGGENQ
jgi:hypothetical protein